MSLWETSKDGHREVMLNLPDVHGNNWTPPWQALGAVYGGGYAFAWFGREPDE
jgi:hypothetical protein